MPDPQGHSGRQYRHVGWVFGPLFADPLFKAADDFISENNLGSPTSDEIQEVTSSLKRNGVTELDDLKNLNRFEGLEVNDYEERILIKKMVKRTESGTGIDRRSYQQFIEYCRFCKNNGEKEEMYLSHVTKEAGGKVQCPVLRDYTCPK